MMSLHKALHRLAGHGNADGSCEHGARNYDRGPARLLRPLYRQVVDDLVNENLPPGAVVLDVGTGPGRLLIELARRRPDLQLIGVDPSPHMLALAQQNVDDAGLASTVSLRSGEAAVLPVDDGIVHAAVSTVTMHHWPDVAAGVTELGRVLRPDGQLLVYDFRFVPSALLAETARNWNPPPALQRSSVRAASWLPIPVFTKYRLTRRGTAKP
jgi:ubiquinone/menaquinone biosynthesis C-methylase UbiE